MKKLFAVLLVAIPFTAFADRFDNVYKLNNTIDYEFDNEKPWVEIEAHLPPYPKAENLLPFYVSAATDNNFFVDAASISVGTDDVVRYTLVVKSAAGAENVSYEGIRCGTRDFKLYAFGRSDGTWAKARTAKWQDIRYKDRNRQQHVLYDDFFCPNKIMVTSPEAAVKALKNGPKL